MNPEEPDRSRRRNVRRTALAALVVVLVLAGIILVVRVIGQPEPSPTPPTPTAENRPVVVEETASLTVPENKRLTAKSFPVQEGRSYLLRFEATTTKPDGTPGSAMYFGISLACSGGGDDEVHKISGTQNLLNGEKVTLANQFLITATSSGERTCRLQMSSPNEAAAAAGATIEVATRWEETPVGNGATSFPSDGRLPMVISSGERRAVYRAKVPVEDPGQLLQIFSTLHVTTCTTVNGSREGGKPLCTATMVDERGSSFDADLRVDVLNDEGRACQSLDLFGDSIHVDRRTHHEMLSFAKEDRLPDDLCGDELQFVLAVDNQGPAPLVVHGAGSSLIAVLGGG